MAYLIAQIQRLSYKTVNFIFGKTGIFIYILGWFLVITGIIMFLQPDKARKAIAQKGFGFVKGYLLITALLLGSMLVSFCNKLSGILSLVVLISGILFLVKAYFLLKKKTAAKVNSWVLKVSVKGLKIYALIQVVVGALMLILQRRIW
jgi:Ni,Fe-hydrogenase I cytochrome b subunit